MGIGKWWMEQNREDTDALSVRDFRGQRTTTVPTAEQRWMRWKKMADIKSGTLDEIIDRRDVTELKDRGLPKSWKCPHCGKRNKMDEFAEELLMRYFKVFRHCEDCGYVHMWELTLTENFKNEVVQYLLQEMRNGKTD